jgi:hypothetical protein
MSLRERTGPELGIIEPCLRSLAKAPPSGPGWLHEIRHDGFRILARKDALREVVVLQKTENALKAEIPALLARGNLGSQMLVLDDKDVVRLLKTAIEQEGSISAFARRHGLNRALLTQVVNRKRPVSSPLVKFLGLRRVYAP